MSEKKVHLINIHPYKKSSNCIGKWNENSSRENLSFPLNDFNSYQEIMIFFFNELFQTGI